MEYLEDPMLDEMDREEIIWGDLINNFTPTVLTKEQWQAIENPETDMDIPF